LVIAKLERYRVAISAEAAIDVQVGTAGHVVEMTIHAKADLAVMGVVTVVATVP
jgi:hypothetical protein